MSDGADGAAIEIARISIEAETAPLLALDRVLQQVLASVSATSAQIEKLEAGFRATLSSISPNMAAGIGAALGPSSEDLRTRKAGIDAVRMSLQDAVRATRVHTNAVNESAVAHQKHGAASHYAGVAAQEAWHVSKALFDEIAAGGSPIRGLMMEFGRIQTGYSMLQKSGLGVSGGIRELGNWIGGLLTPMRLASGGLVGLAALTAAAALSYESAQERMQRAVEGTGRAAGLTAVQLAALADTGAHAGNMGIGESRGIAAGYAQAGLPGSMIASLLADTPRYARFTDQGNSEAGGELASAFRDPVAGIRELDKHFGLLNDRLDGTIRDLVASGDLEGARRVELEAFGAALKATTDNTWAVGDAFREMKRWGGSLFEGVGERVNHFLGGDQAPEVLLQRYRQMLPSTFDSQFAVGNLSRTYVQGQIDRLREEINRKTDPAAAQRAQQANELSMAAGPIVKALLPEITREQQRVDQIALLGRVLSNPDALGVMKLPREMIEGAYGRSVVMQAMNRPGKQQNQDYQLRMASADAFSIGEKAIVDARRAELEVLRQTGDIARAAAAAQMSMNEAIAKGNQDAEDRLQIARQEAGMVGLSPFARAMQAVKNKYEGYGGIFDKDATTGTDVRKLPGISKDLDEATRQVRLALEDNAPRIEAGGSKVVEALESVAEKIAAVPIGGVAPGGSASPFGGLGGVRFPTGAGIATPEMIAAAASGTGVSKDIIAAIGKVENGGRLTGGTTMLGSNGKPSTAWGFGQLTDGAAADVARRYPGFDKYDPRTAVFGSAAYFRIQLDRNHGDTVAAARGYGGTANYPDKLAAAMGHPLDIGVNARASAVKPIASTMSGSDHEAYATEQGAVRKQFTSTDTSLFGTTYSDATRHLDGQIALLATQRESFGQSDAAIRGATEAQQLWNRYVSEGTAPAGTLSKQTGALADAVRAYGKQAAEVARQQEDMRGRQQFMDTLRGDSSDLFGGILKAGAHGQYMGAAFSASLSRIQDQLLDHAANALTSGLFGGGAGQSSGGGIFGSLLSGLMSGGGGGFQGWWGGSAFASGTSDAPGGVSLVGEKGPELVNMPAHAQVIPAGETAEILGRAGAGTGGNVTVNVHGAPSTPHVSTQRSGGGHTIDIHFVDQALAHAAEKNTRGFQAFAKRMGTGRVGG